MHPFTAYCFSQFKQGNYVIQLNNNHRISKGEEPIPLLHCHFIGMHNILFPSQRGYQHDQGGFRKVEIGDQTVDHLELVAWINENLSPAASGF